MRGRDHIGRSCIFAWLFVFGLSAQASAAPQRQGDIALWWSPLLNLESIGDLEKRLDRPILENGRVIPYSAYVTVTQRLERIRTCRELLLILDLPAPYDQSLWGPAKGTGRSFIECNALRLLRKAQPARTSWLPDLDQGPGLLGDLPYMLEGLMSFDSFCWGIEMNDSGITWGDSIAQEQLDPGWWDRHSRLSYEELSNAIPQRPQRWHDIEHMTLDELGIEMIWEREEGDAREIVKIDIKIRDQRREDWPTFSDYSLYPLIRADLDGDTLEDLALMVIWSPAGGSLLAAEYFVLSKLGKSQPLLVANTEDIRALYGHRHCD